HSFYYFNDEIPSEEDFRNTIADYITFEVNMITHGRGYLFGLEDDNSKYYTEQKPDIQRVAEKLEGESDE
ncbi:MAG TPA: SAM-dependent DNA methyltransferase, partial [Firmicutes bacterium]|nr:SAM-dependent DNA methyltransferase [Bacillota bacterium]